MIISMHRNITSNQKGEWNSILEMIGSKDIFYTNEYMRFFENERDMKAEMFIFQEGKDVAAYPYLKKQETSGISITSERYGGPISNTMDPGFIKRFQDCFMKFRSDSMIKNEQYIMHPFLAFMSGNGETRKVGSLAYVDLSKDEDALWSGMRKYHKRRIRDSVGMTVTFSEDLSGLKGFYGLYEDNMRRAGATESVLDFDYLKSLASVMKGYFEMVNVIFAGEVIASTFVLRSMPFVYFCYGGQSWEHNKLQPKHFQIYHSMLAYKKRGYRYMVLGSGRRMGTNDSLMAFKTGFSNDIVNVYEYRSRT
ncbi:MAG: hypothetical protein DRO99_03000 [Candidatus Aenigmatarchaeota archaeon]|nr:MAG: hypothetical protein DRO99_03000 [Candidatus Aenigmarchaeota archaeon]